MGRHSFGAAAGRMMRAAARAERTRQQQIRRHIAAERREQILSERQARLDAKDRQREYVASRQEEADDLTREVCEREDAINQLLAGALKYSPKLKLEGIKQTFSSGSYVKSRWEHEEPKWETYQPNRPSFFTRLIPGSRSRHQKVVDEAQLRHHQDLKDHQSKMMVEQRRYAEFQAAEQGRKDAVARFNDDIDRMMALLDSRDHGSVVRFYGFLLERSIGAECDAVGAEVGYSPESKHLVVDLELPDVEVVPTETSFRYVKSADRIDTVVRPTAKLKLLYASLVSQVVLKAIDVVFRGGRSDVVDILTINGMLETVDPATGQNVRPCLVSARISADTFAGLRLSAVNPEQCLRSLKASVSRSPAELLPVKPLVEMNMVDPRFIETRDVLSSLDTRPNLMDLSPNEFENLISQLFEAMGLQTKQTQASRDGGVDCVAFDLRPVFGGKVVIQAKRYKGTVGVSAVRDLYGTMQNEGANRGILVTTSGYGKASLDFAREKPLELIDGGGLLHLLAEHAGIEARIVMPDEWTDRSNTGE